MGLQDVFGFFRRRDHQHFIADHDGQVELPEHSSIASSNTTCETSKAETVESGPTPRRPAPAGRARTLIENCFRSNSARPANDS